MSMAKNALIPLMTKYQWTDKSITAFAQLFTKLELHPFRQREFGERALITYQARVRREWHDQLRSGSSFNIGVINEDLLHNIYRELLDKAQLLLLSDVSTFSCSLGRRTLTPLFPPFSPLIPQLSRCPCWAPCIMHPPPCIMHPSPCIIHHAPCTMHHAPCTMHRAPRSMHHAPFTMLHAPRTLVPRSSKSRHASIADHIRLGVDVMTQLRSVHGNLASSEGQPDPVRTPRRRGRRDRDQYFSREASGSGRPRNPSCSRSPTRRTSYAPAHSRSSPPPYKSPSKPPGFHSSTAPQGLPVCALCLATNPHDVRKCRSETLWDGSKARCRKSEEGRLITPAGTTLCSDWNSRRGCTSNSHEQRHECSSCGSKDHGAQGCP